MISVLWRMFFDICCFRKGPQDLPMSRDILVLTLLVYGFASFLLALPTQSIEIAILSGLIDILLLIILCYILLYLWRKPERWQQATMALSGTGIVFSSAAIPLFFLQANIDQDDPLSLWLLLLVISLLSWNIAVMAHIIRNTLSSSFATGLLASLFYIWVSTVTITSLIPQPSTP